MKNQNMKNRNRYILPILVMLVSATTWAEEQAQGAAQGAAQSEKQADEEETLLSVDEILKRDPETGDYVNEERCLRSHRIRKMDVLDEKHVAVQVSRDEYYLIQFKSRCLGLRPGKPIMQETRSNSLCAHDSIRSMDQWGFGRMRPGPPCSIPGFQSITKEQLLHLKDALKANKRKKNKKQA